MSEAVADSTAKAKRPPRLIRAAKALNDRRMLAMLLLSFAAGIPYGVVLGALNAWFADVKVNVAQAGVLSFIILAYSFKFIWAPGFQRAQFPVTSMFGARRSWLITFQILIALLIGVLALTDPTQSLGIVAGAALAIALFSATHDIVLDAWRIEVARNDEDLDLMSALYQFGYRFAGLLTGALALVAAERLGWPVTIAMLGGVMLLSIMGTLVAPNSEVSQEKDAGRLAGESGIGARLRSQVSASVMIAWGIAIAMILLFMWNTLTFTPPTPEQIEAGAATSPPSPRLFTRHQAPIIVALTVLVPALMAAWLLGQRGTVDGGSIGTSSLTKAGDAIFGSIIVPLMDLVRRLGWAVILVLALILTYRFADLVWGSFAFFFYLDDRFGALWMTNDEVAVASKTFGVIMTIAGSGLGAMALVVLGRMPCLFIGALLAGATNLLFADLAAGRYIAETATFVPTGGGDAVTAFMAMTGLDHVIELIPPLFGLDNRPELTRLMGAIAGENLAVGFASVASVAFLTSIVNPRYAAVQYALLASLTMLIGSLGRAWLGELIETDGYYTVFVTTFWIGMIPVVLVAIEWARQARYGAPSDHLKAEQAAEANSG